MKLSVEKLPSNKKFGIFFTFVFIVIAFYLFFKNYDSLAIISFSVSFIILGVALLKPNILMPFNKAWMRLGLILGFIVSPIILGFIYFFLLSPISLITRAFGRDELNLRFQSRRSYWRDRKSFKTQLTRFKNQF